MISYPRNFSYKGQSRSTNCQDYPRRSCHRTRLKFMSSKTSISYPLLFSSSSWVFIALKKKKKITVARRISVFTTNQDIFLVFFVVAQSSKIQRHADINQDHAFHQIRSNSSETYRATPPAAVLQLAEN